VTTTADPLPDDNDALKAALIETRAKLSGAEALIEHLRLLIAKMKRELFGPRSERSQRLIDQLELQLEELAAAAGEDEAKAETDSIPVQGFTRRKTAAIFLTTCRAAASCIRLQQAARAAAAQNSRRSARMSPRRWM